ncbi:interphotoreceptor matrix proteoglycan 1-like [Oncorhynchus tshawytscha]|uniref:interphotoreceptor matrix proteoglycan 1-like n=1 Tax=Oncorhynchus tshawytscha TaxID=74940 RepID=UPI001C3C5026|nr:interphotoreceptor matrix proteoglycan 1-like [Oncorhynchus tshawytscha]
MGDSGNGPSDDAATSPSGAAATSAAATGLSDAATMGPSDDATSAAATGSSDAATTDPSDATATGSSDAATTDPSDATATGSSDAATTDPSDATATGSSDAATTDPSDATATGSSDAATTDPSDATATGSSDAATTDPSDATATGSSDAATTDPPDATATGSSDAATTDPSDATATAPSNTASTSATATDPTPVPYSHQWSCGPCAEICTAAVPHDLQVQDSFEIRDVKYKHFLESLRPVKHTTNVKMIKDLDRQRTKRSTFFTTGVKICPQEKMKEVISNHRAYYKLRVCQEAIWEAFRIFLDRVPNSEEYKHWTYACQHGSLCLDEVARNFSSTQEHIDMVARRVAEQEKIQKESGEVPTAGGTEIEKCSKTPSELFSIPNEAGDITEIPNIVPDDVVIEEQIVEFSVTIADPGYSELLLRDPAAPQYHDITRNLHDTMVHVFDKLPGYKDLRVLGFRLVEFRSDDVSVRYAVVFETNGEDHDTESKTTLEPGTETVIYTNGHRLKDLVSKALSEETSLPVDIQTLSFEPDPTVSLHNELEATTLETLLEEVVGHTEGFLPTVAVGEEFLKDFTDTPEELTVVPLGDSVTVLLTEATTASPAIEVTPNSPQEELRESPPSEEVELPPVAATDEMLEAEATDEMLEVDATEEMLEIEEPAVDVTEETTEVEEPAVDVTEETTEVEATEETIEVEEPAVDVTEETIEVEEPAVDVTEETTEVEEPAVDVTEETIEVEEPAVDVTEETIEVEEPAVDVTEETTEVEEPEWMLQRRRLR